jgi:hypothetical protein
LKKEWIYYQEATPTPPLIRQTVDMVEVMGAAVGVVAAVGALEDAKEVEEVVTTVIAPTCQLCGKEGHTVIRCYKRFDASFTGASDPKSASSATTNYGADSNWYMDTGNTDHITRELDKLTIRDKYSGGDQVHTASGAGMMINHIGHSILHTPSGDIVL